MTVQQFKELSRLQEEAEMCEIDMKDAQEFSMRVRNHIELDEPFVFEAEDIPNAVLASFADIYETREKERLEKARRRFEEALDEYNKP